MKVAGLLLLATASVVASQKPNFAGTWIVVSPAELAGRVFHDDKGAIVSKASWDGDRLMTQSVAFYPSGPKFELKEGWSLDSACHLVIESTTTPASGHPVKMTLVHRKK